MAFIKMILSNVLLKFKHIISQEGPLTSNLSTVLWKSITIQEGPSLPLNPTGEAVKTM